MLTVQRGGRYHRVADPSWQDPLDGTYAAHNGGRWNAPASHPAVYLCATIPVARAIVNHNLAGLPYGPEDLQPAAAPLLLDVHVTPASFLEVTGPAGRDAVRCNRRLRQLRTSRMGRASTYARTPPIARRKSGSARRSRSHTAAAYQGAASARL
ncbi:MAG: hypothetical protein M0T77_07460 [Actinomycetota bacterium]|nr:hypothetical protein [Actinomycetota bacterium]